MKAHSKHGGDSPAAPTVDERDARAGAGDLRDALPTEDMQTGQGAGDTGEGRRREDLSDRLIKTKVKAALVHTPPQPLAISRYVLLDCIAAGGMGEVYEAYDEQLDRKIAIKLLRPEVRTANPSARKRLLREAQILAQVSHPNVVQVYEAGEAGDQVFIAMELVRGTPLSRWLERHAPDPSRHWRRILEKFIAAGRGLAAVHAAGLLHRDFKPANVLVGEDGRVRVVDFGLARATAAEEVTAPDDAGTEAVSALRQVSLGSLTSTGMVVGTPAYMAPEQMRGREVDRRSDEFSFCVALYEALYGRRPFRGDDLASLRAAVTSGEIPAPPSDSRVPAWIWRVLERGLAAAPDARYPSMGALLAALDRDPVRRRRRGLAAAALLLGGMLSGGAAVMGALGGRGVESCAAGAEELAGVWTPQVQARARAQEAFAATRLPYAATAWQSIDRGIEEYVERWQGQRLAACEATHVDGTQTRDELVLRNRCLDDQAQRLRALIDRLTRADAALVANAQAGLAFVGAPESCGNTQSLARAAALPSDPVAQVRLESMRIALNQARMLAIAGHFSEALVLIDEQIRAAEALGHAPALAEALYHAGELRLERGAGEDVARGVELLQRALDLAEGAGDDPLVADIWNALARRRRAAPSAEQTAFWARRALAAAERMEDRGVRRARALHNLGTALYWQQRFPDAERHQRAAIEMAADAGATRLVVAEMRHALANTLHARGEYQEARDTYQQALDITRAELGDGHPRVQSLRFDFADFLIESADKQAEGAGGAALERAREHLEAARAMRAELYGAGSPRVAKVHVALASLEIKRGALERAEDHAKQALALYEGALGREHPDLAEPLMFLGIISFHGGRYEETLGYWQRERALRLAAASPEPMTLGITESNLGEVLVELGRHDEALRAFDRAQRHYDRVPEVPSAYLAFLYKGRGQALVGKGRPAEAVAYLELALRMFREARSGALELADTAWTLARALRAGGTGAGERARSLAAEARAIYAAREDTRARAAEIDAWSRP